MRTCLVPALPWTPRLLDTTIQFAHLSSSSETLFSSATVCNLANLVSVSCCNGRERHASFFIPRVCRSPLCHSDVHQGSAPIRHREG